MIPSRTGKMQNRRITARLIGIGTLPLRTPALLLAVVCWLSLLAGMTMTWQDDYLKQLLKGGMSGQSLNTPRLQRKMKSFEGKGRHYTPSDTMVPRSKRSSGRLDREIGRLCINRIQSQTTVTTSLVA